MKILIVSIIAFFQFLSGNVSDSLSTDSLTEKIALDSTISEKQLLQEWVLTEGWFNEGPIVFEKKDSTIHQNGLYKVFTFQKDASINFQLYNPQRYGICGVGLMGMKEGKWTLEENNQYLKIHIKGEHWGESEFEYETRYVVEHISRNKLKLVVDRKMLSSEKNF